MLPTSLGCKDITLANKFDWGRQAACDFKEDNVDQKEMLKSDVPFSSPKQEDVFFPWKVPRTRRGVTHFGHCSRTHRFGFLDENNSIERFTHWKAGISSKEKRRRTRSYCQYGCWWLVLLFGNCTCTYSIDFAHSRCPAINSGKTAYLLRFIHESQLPNTVSKL